MAIRAFRPSFSLHTMRSFGALVGMLLVRALDRSERVYNAMKLRGFSDRFRVARVSRLRAPDGLALFGSIAISTALWWWGDAGP